MRFDLLRKLLAWLALLSAGAAPALAAQYPAPKEGDFVMESFRFHDGQSLPEVKVHYRTIGDPANEPVLVLHGTAGSGASMLVDGFAGVLFGGLNAGAGCGSAPTGRCGRFSPAPRACG